MKTCDEMLESVLSKAKTDIVKRKQRTKTALSIGAAGLCLVLILGLTLAPWGPEQPPLPTDAQIADPPIPTMEATGDTPVEPKLYLLGSNENKVFQKPMIMGVTMPANSWIRIRRFGDMGEAEREQAMQEERAFLEAFNEEQFSTLGQFSGGASAYYGQYNIVSVLKEGTFSLEFADHTLISSINATTTQVGAVGQTTVRYHETATYGEGENQITFPAGTLFYRWYWNISPTTRYTLLDDPTIPLSTIRDTITITINYTNGATEVLKVDVTLNDEGKIFMTLRGNNL